MADTLNMPSVLIAIRLMDGHFLYSQGVELSPSLEISVADLTKRVRDKLSRCVGLMGGPDDERPNEHNEIINREMREATCLLYLAMIVMLSSSIDEMFKDGLDIESIIRQAAMKGTRDA